MGPYMNFQADSIHGVLFPVPGQHQDDALKLWGSVFPNDSPDGFQRATSSPSLNSSASGEREGFNTTINAQVGRIDLILTHPLPQVPVDPSPPRMGDIAGATARITDLMKRIILNMKVGRVAIVLDLAKSITPGSESEVLLQSLPNFPFPDNVSDVNLQFNSRRSFETVPDLLMNRLCTLATGQVGFVINPQIQGSSVMKMTPYVGLKIDVNSNGNFQFPAEVVGSIINELSAEVLAIAGEGVKRLLK